MKTDIYEKEIQLLLGKQAAIWTAIRKYLAEYYPDCEPVFSIEGKDKNYVYRYRKSSRTLITLCPEKASLIALIVLGKKEVLKVESILDKLNNKMKKSSFWKLNNCMMDAGCG